LVGKEISIKSLSSVLTPLLAGLSDLDPIDSYGEGLALSGEPYLKQLDRRTLAQA